MLDRDLPGIHGDELCQIITQTEDPPMIVRRPTLRSSEIELDPRTGTVKRDGRSIELSNGDVHFPVLV